MAKKGKVQKKTKVFQCDKTILNKELLENENVLTLIYEPNKRNKKSKKSNNESPVPKNSDLSGVELKTVVGSLHNETSNFTSKNSDRKINKVKKSKKKKSKKKCQSSVKICPKVLDIELENCEDKSVEKLNNHFCRVDHIVSNMESSTISQNNNKKSKVPIKNVQKLSLDLETMDNSSIEKESNALKDKSKVNKIVLESNSDSFSSSEEDILNDSEQMDGDVYDALSSEESEISSDESDNSVSSFNIDSYPSDTDEDEDKEEEEKEQKHGIPVNALPSAELDEKEGRTIFVGNLPKTVERDELKRWFSRFGKVECVRLRSAPIADLEIPRKISVIKKSFHDNRNNIHAYIRYKDIKGSFNALQANGSKYGDHTLRVDCAKHEGGYDAKKGVFVGNVPFGIEEDSLISFFSKCGDIDSVRIIRDKETGVGKGFAYVNFICSSSVPLALKLDGEVLEKRQLRVKPVKYNKKVKHGSLAPTFQGKITSQKFRGGPFGVRKDQIKGGPGGKKYLQSFREKRGKSHEAKNVKESGMTRTHPTFRKNGFQKNKFQGELSKRKDRKPFKRKSLTAKKREIYSKILTNKKENN